MNLSKISQHFIEGKSNREIAQIMKDSGDHESIDTSVKALGWLRKVMDGGNSAEALLLVKQKKNGKGDVISETFARRSLQDESIPDHLQVDRLTTAPGGGQWRKYKSVIDTGAILKAELLEKVKPLKITYSQPKATGPLALEIMLTDHHFGKMPFSHKVEDWSLENSKAEYLKAIEFHIAQAPKEVSTLILPIGNDLLHINSNTGSTKKGTPMEYSTNYHHLYSFVREVVAGSVLSLSKRFNIEVVIVPGNHDEDACYRIGDYLEGLFSGSERVNVNNSGHDRKYYAWGKNLIMWCHGEKVKIEKLHDSFSVDVPHLFINAKYRFAHTGHLHKSMKVETFRKTVTNEYLGTEAEVCPSLSPTDNWHFDNMYTGNQRRCKSYLYHESKGKIAEYFYSI